MKEQVEFKKMREFGDIISDTFLFIRQNFVPLMKSFLCLAGLFILAGAISSIITQLQLASLNKGMAGIGRISSFDKLGDVALNYIFVIIFMILNYTAMYVSILSYIAVYIEKGNVAPTLAEVWGYFKYYFLRVMGSGVLMSVFLGMAFMFCLIPGVYVFPAFNLFFAIMILENGDFSHSFGRSFKLLSGEWWVTAGTLFIVYIIFYACTLFIQLPSLVMTMAKAFTNDPGNVNRPLIFISSISQYLSQIFMVIPIICSALIYFNLVERKENLGLLNRIGGFGQHKDNEHNDQEQY